MTDQSDVTFHINILKNSQVIWWIIDDTFSHS